LDSEHISQNATTDLALSEGWTCWLVAAGHAHIRAYMPEHAHALCPFPMIHPRHSAAQPSCTLTRLARPYEAELASGDLFCRPPLSFAQGSFFAIFFAIFFALTSLPQELH